MREPGRPPPASPSSRPATRVPHSPRAGPARSCVLAAGLPSHLPEIPAPRSDSSSPRTISQRLVRRPTDVLPPNAWHSSSSSEPHQLALITECMHCSLRASCVQVPNPQMENGEGWGWSLAEPLLLSGPQCSHLWRKEMEPEARQHPTHTSSLALK